MSTDERFQSQEISPLDDTFTFIHFSELLEDNKKMLMPILVGKDAIVVGLSNNAFQDIMFRAKLHPRIKASELK